MKLVEYIRDGSVTLKEVESPINGTLTVKWDLTYGYQIMGGGLWQVGGPVETVWREALKVAPELNSEKQVLILGLGGGTIAKLIRKKYFEVRVVGVDIDPVIVNLGKEYLGLEKLNIEIHIDDAYQFILKSKDDSYQLICVDTYLGDKFPEKFESETFLKNIERCLSSDGVAIFNRLYYGDKRKLADKFEKELTKVFKIVTPVYPEVSAMYICRKN